MNNLDSVHLQDYPRMDEFEKDKCLVEAMDKVRAICSAALSIRDKHNLRVRLPLNKITIIGNNIDDIKKFDDIILDEINVKNIDFETDIEKKADFKLQLNFQKLGSFIGSKMPMVLKALKANEWKIIDEKLIIADVELNNEYYSLNLVPKNTDNSTVVQEYNIVVELDINITRELKLEGIVRDIIRAIQQSRKEANLDISDRIFLNLSTIDNDIIEAINKHSEYIKEQTLSKELFINSENNFKFIYNISINNVNLEINFDIEK